MTPAVTSLSRSARRVTVAAARAARPGPEVQVLRPSSRSVPGTMDSAAGSRWQVVSARPAPEPVPRGTARSSGAARARAAPPDGKRAYGAARARHETVHGGRGCCTGFLFSLLAGICGCTSGGTGTPGRPPAANRTPGKRSCQFQGAHVAGRDRFGLRARNAGAPRKRSPAPAAAAARRAARCGAGAGAVPRWTGGSPHKRTRARGPPGPARPDHCRPGKAFPVAVHDRGAAGGDTCGGHLPAA